MKIVKKRAERRIESYRIWWLFTLVVLAVGMWLGQAGALGALRGAWQNLSSQLGASATGTLPVMALDISFENYNQLLQQREQALEAGVLYAADASFIPATVQINGEEVPVRARLLPGAAQHLGDDEKWNLELETRANRELLREQRLNLLDPADNNWLAEWAFLEALRREELPATGYEFVQLLLNGGQRGIYAVQQGIEPILRAPDGAVPQVVVGYDVDPLWEALAYFGGDLGAAVADPVTNLAGDDLRYATVAGSRDPLIEDDPLLAAQYERARALLLGLQRGELAASEVFDADAYGRFLALSDLWGASAALSPLNLRYAYDADRDRLIPIGRGGNPLAGEDRVPLASAYGDARLQEAYARAAARISEPDYLDELRDNLEPALAELATAAGRSGEAADIWPILAERQALLRRSLQPARPVIAQLGPPERAQEAIIEVNVANALNLPLEILGFDIDGATFLEVNPAWISAGESYLSDDDGRVILAPAPSAAGGLNFVTFELPVTQIIAQDSELDFLNEMDLQVATRVLGLEATQLTPAASGARVGTVVRPTATP